MNKLVKLIVAVCQTLDLDFAASTRISLIGFCGGISFASIILDMSGLISSVTLFEFGLPGIVQQHPYQYVNYDHQYR